MSNKRLISIIFIVLLIAGNAFFGFNYFSVSKKTETIKFKVAKTELNQKIIDFTCMFIEKVLQAENEVDFETRLSLENAVRDLKDKEVLAEWTNFVGSKTEKEAQDSVKKLLGILVHKIQK